MLERFDTSAGNPVKDILLKLNLPDHRSILTDSKVTPTKHGDEALKSKNYKEVYVTLITECFSRSDEVLKLKNFKKDASLKLSSYQIKKGHDLELYEIINLASSLDHLYDSLLSCILVSLDKHAHTFPFLKSCVTISLDMLYLEHFMTSRKTLSIRVAEDFAQSVGSSNATASDSLYLLVLIIRTSQSRQHDNNESVSYYLTD
ncbi:hypothetical protein Tco_0618117 [Tanacetum coccineum]